MPVATCCAEPTNALARVYSCVVGEQLADVPLPARMSLSSPVVWSSVSVAPAATSDDLARRLRGLDVVTVLERRARRRRADVDDRLAEQAQRADRGARLVVMRDCFRCPHSSATSTSAPTNSTSVTLPTSTPATRTTAPLFRPCDVRELRLQVVALPGESALRRRRRR